MDWHELADPSDGFSFRVPVDDSYRTCSVCSDDCEPDVSFGSDQHEARIAYVCPQHGMQSLVDPFEGRR